ncbi:hypothetical protein MA16_Dca000207 [Dendrobium catenatum]|uniref:Uncharacterized protein n=1 Tax=Dendrobium catenatum TaxID=906689 RepID=A0A2I0WT78_9ASPA|nr:hypothetical protein MA16_Dca000205 [Dendrobium catenatum]PKU78864.1 hypothetical protein MA16_Dca000207 [Dendrobium catenatum]
MSASVVELDGINRRAEVKWIGQLEGNNMNIGVRLEIWSRFLLKIKGLAVSRGVRLMWTGIRHSNC